ncbi:hypothetical protein GE061_003529 [Apolygus lucorum]|uniref:G-protein coupled receptors family 1 profile domain-containing protein n=1 Tax=Apolygus lucorum TaxID=248454 RepID=A0A6A4JCH3_APOLU|nr:hypothetical protein GE061_003529 [Apolygus lucorum]
MSFLPLRLQRRSEGRTVYFAHDLNLKGDVYLLYGFIVLLIRISVGLLGLVGNTFSLVVWSRPHLKSPSSVILLVLAVSDTLVILCGLWVDLPDAYGFLGHYKGNLMLDYIQLKYEMNYYTVWSMFVSRAVYFMAWTASMYLTLLLTVERSVCIFNPFRFSEWCSYARTCKFVLAVVIFSILCNLGKLCWERRVIGFYKVILDGEEFTMYKEVETKLYHNPIYAEVVLVWMVIVLKYLVPLTCIVTLNTITYIKLKKVNKERLTMTEAQKNDNKLTRMIIYVVLEFLAFSSFTAFAGTSNLFPSPTASCWFLISVLQIKILVRGNHAGI